MDDPDELFDKVTGLSREINLAIAEVLRTHKDLSDPMYVLPALSAVMGAWIRDSITSDNHAECIERVADVTKQVINSKKFAKALPAAHGLDDTVDELIQKTKRQYGEE